MLVSIIFYLSFFSFSLFHYQDQHSEKVLDENIFRRLVIVLKKSWKPVVFFEVLASGGKTITSNQINQLLSIEYMN